jgi:hypothetical protein
VEKTHKIIPAPRREPRAVPGPVRRTHRPASSHPETNEPGRSHSAAVSHLKILTDHPVTTKVHGVHKAITVPPMPAFFAHRLATARFGEYRDPVFHAGKIRRDYKQAALVAKKIKSDGLLNKNLGAIVAGLTEDQRQKMHQAPKPLPNMSNPRI